MAVRNFDLTEPKSSRLLVLESAPTRRQDLRRSKRRCAIIGIFCLAAPFAAALVVLGVAH
jgi:hypothetical protein